MDAPAWTHWITRFLKINPWRKAGIAWAFGGMTEGINTQISDSLNYFRLLIRLELSARRNEASSPA